MTTAAHPLEGVQRSIYTTATSTEAGNCDCAVQPPEGVVWEIQFLCGKQDDGAVTVSWLYQGPEYGSAVQISSGTGAPNTPWHFGASDDLADSTVRQVMPIIATNVRYPIFRFAASAGAKTSTVVGLAREFKGVKLDALAGG